MTDHPRFQTAKCSPDLCYRQHHGAALVGWVLSAADWWLSRRSVRSIRLPDREPASKFGDGVWPRSTARRHVPQMAVHMGKLMRSRLVSSTVILGLAIGTSSAQDVVRVRGTIERIEGGTYLVKARDGTSLKLTLAPNAGVAASVKSALSDIKPGAFIGVAAVPQADGTLRALEAHIFHESMRGTGEGHRPWDLLPKSTMTNATVHDVVQTVDGNTVTLIYKDGEQKIVVPAGTVVVTYLPGSVAELKAGAAVFVPAANRQADGTLLAQRIMVGRDIAPPQ